MSFYQRAYNFLILPAMLGGFHVLSPFVPKIRTGFEERRQLFERLAGIRDTVGKRRLILFHCASAGEFESLRPLASCFDRERVALGVSYFSPSARRAASRSEEFDFTDYSPVDQQSQVTAYFDIIQPDAIAITKHDVWPNFVWEAAARRLPTFLINGNFHPKSLKMVPGLRALHRPVYNLFTEILTVSDEDSRRAAELCARRDHIRTIGDSRYDRVLSRAKRKIDLPKAITEYCRERPIVMAGSTHADDEHLLLPVVKKLHSEFPNLGCVVIPHDPSDAALKRIHTTCREFGLSRRESTESTIDSGVDVLIVNRGGMLADLYQAGTIAYVGGGFGKGVHSVLEPMAHGLPVLCGPNIAVSHEANMALEEKLLTTVTGRKQVQQVLSDWLTPGNAFDNRMRSTREFVERRAGVAQIIAQRIMAVLDGKS